MDVLDSEAAMTYLRKQTQIEEDNGMWAFEFFADNPESPKKLTLIECFPSDSSQIAHIENIRIEEFKSIFTNFNLEVYGNLPESALERMRAAGFWPPEFKGRFKHMPYFIGFRRS